MIRHSVVASVLVAALSLAAPTSSQAFCGFFGFNFGFGGWGGPGWWGPGYWGGPGYWNYGYYGYNPYRYYGWYDPFLTGPHYGLIPAYTYPPLLTAAVPAVPASSAK